MAKVRSIVIERQFCSGGREIAALVAEKLGIPCYDKELAEFTAQKLGVNVDEIFKYEETLGNPLLSPVSFRSGIDRKLNLNEKIFDVQASIITAVAKKGPCVIVGRCADYILKNNVPTLSVFVYASPDSRIQHAVDFHDIPYAKAQPMLKKMDRKRAEYYKLNTQKDWDDMNSYDLCINSGRLGVENCAAMIAAAAEKIK